MFPLQSHLKNKFRKLIVSNLNLFPFQTLVFGMKIFLYKLSFENLKKTEL